jgi:hypothetical protein
MSDKEYDALILEDNADIELEEWTAPTELRKGKGIETFLSAEVDGKIYLFEKGSGIYLGLYMPKVRKINPKEEIAAAGGGGAVASVSSVEVEDNDKDAEKKLKEWTAPTELRKGRGIETFLYAEANGKIYLFEKGSRIYLGLYMTKVRKINPKAVNPLAMLEESAAAGGSLRGGSNTRARHSGRGRARRTQKKTNRRKRRYSRRN